LLNAINIIETWGLLNKKFRQKKKCAQKMGILHEKNWPKKAPPSSHMREGKVGSFLTLVLTKLVTLKRDKKLRVSEVRNCNTN
jgi:hypothetical protein